MSYEQMEKLKSLCSMCKNYKGFENGRVICDKKEDVAIYSCNRAKCRLYKNKEYFGA